MNPGEKILGVEGGGTKTAWVLVARPVAGVADAGSQLQILDQGKLPPSNFRLATPERLRSIFRELPKEIARVGVFLAGCGTAEDRQTLSKLCAETWPQAKIITGSDRDSDLAAALGHGDGIVVNAGTFDQGPSAFGRRIVEREQENLAQGELGSQQTQQPAGQILGRQGLAAERVRRAEAPERGVP